jgi:cell division protein FtsQ
MSKLEVAADAASGTSPDPRKARGSAGLRESRESRDPRSLDEGLFSRAKKRSERESPAKKAPAAESPFERSTARRETGLAGTSARSGSQRATGLTRSSQIPEWPQAHSPQARSTAGRKGREYAKLYNRDAAKISGTLAERKSEAPRSGGRRKPGSNAKLLIALVLLVALGTGLYIALPEVTLIKTVSVNGMNNTRESEILQALALEEGASLVDVDIPAMEARIGTNPKIAEVHIRRSLPDSLVVNLVERVGVACLLVNEELGTRSIAVDAQGVAFAYMDNLTAQGKLPVLSGIRFERFVPGQRLPEFLTPLLKDIEALSGEKPSLLDAFSELKIVRVSDSEAELLLFPAGKTVPVRMPARLSRASLGSVLLVLDILSSRQDAGSVQEIDFRTGTIVYRTKEAHSG